ncbi:GNAT family N-acetyltransferase [Nocardia wallacei]|uniref:GNAT family N-acetyltransferase n=1 Tax=Nocardia wallacei TaxID=480035 RepID=UPI002453DEF9|nr:GNAT family N-acetyltransferase [Nocardia wallacei]
MSAPEFSRYDADQARGLRATVEEIYRRSYVEAIASGELFDSPTEFMARFDAYTEPHRTRGFELVIARVDGEPAGQAWGWPLGPNAGWWRGLRLDSGDVGEFTAENGFRTFALSEIMVCEEYAGHGLGHALHDELLRARPERRATLLVEPDNLRAYNAYRKWGWERVGSLQPSWPGAPSLDVLIRELPAATGSHTHHQAVRRGRGESDG